MSKLYARVALAVVVTTVGCTRPAEHIRFDGSAGVAPLVNALATEYRAKNPRATLDIATGLGSSARIQAVADGHIDAAMASHGIDVAAIRARGLEVHEIARTPVVFAVHSSVPIQAMTRANVCDVYSGKHTSWRELGGPDLPIIAMMRPAAEVDAEIALAEIPCLKALDFSRLRIVERPDDMAAQLGVTMGAFGLTSMTYVQQSGGKLRALTLDGVSPEGTNVERGTYTLARRAYLVTKQPVPPAVRRFLEYVRSADGQRVIRANGAVPSRE
jgi:phosphate transport system substrate-binding protein